MTKRKLQRVFCALFGHGRIGRYREADLRVYVCDRCVQLVGVSNGRIGLMDIVVFPTPYPDELESERVWLEWGKQ